MLLWFGPPYLLFARSGEQQLRQQILFLKAELELSAGGEPSEMLQEVSHYAPR